MAKEAKILPTLKEVEEWLDSIPRANVGRSAELLYKFLKQLPNADFNHQLYFDVLEKLQPIMNHIWECLRKHFIGQSTITKEQRPQIVALAQALENRYATAYAILVSQIVRVPDKEDKKIHGIALLRALDHLRRVLVASFQLHSQPPDYLWLKIHKLYAHAEKNSLLDKKIKSTDHNLHRCAEDCYKHCLLLSIANPFHLDEQDIDKVDQALFNWAEYAILSETDEKEPLFVIYLDHDCKPQYVDYDKLKDPSTRHLYMYTGKLVEHIENSLKQRADAEVAQDIMTAMPKRLLIYLQAVWGTLHKREHVRTVQNGTATVCLGLYSIHYNTGDKTTLTATEKKTDLQLIAKEENEDKEEIFKIPEKKPAYKDSKSSIPPAYDPWDLLYKNQAPTEQQAEIKKKIEEVRRFKSFQWKIIDKSHGGYRLLTTKENISNVQPGELIAVQESSGNFSDNWSIGTICWSKLVIDEGVHVGIQLMAKSIMPVLVRLCGENQEETQHIRGILLYNPLNTKKKETLLLPSIRISLGQTAFLHHTSLETEIKIKEVLDTNKYFIHVNFDKISTIRENLQISEETLKEEGKDQANDIWDDI